MKPQLSDLVKDNVVKIGLTFLFILIITLFCRAMQYSLIIPLFLIFSGLHLIWIKRSSISMFVYLGLLLTLIIFATHIIQTYTDFSYYYIPVAGIAMLTMLLFNDLHVAFLMAFSSSIVVTLICGGEFNMFLTFFLGGLTGMYSIRDARTRAQLISAGLFVSIIHLVCLVLFNLDSQIILTKQFAISNISPLILNGFISAFLVVATFSVFEFLFGVLTNFSLLELSDFNRPLLKRMILEAPGTYHHSLVVSNLAEAAADTIGANSLLTRVGAYYHDIGKMVKSEYFTENQLVGGNIHDKIEPSISRLVILNHVKEGIELGKKYKLNQLIIDFIPQHHGTSLMYYFYQKALEEAEEGEVVKEEDFRYPGPKPQTRETAITLLADSVEGATRALDEPTAPRIKETVQKIVNNKFIDGQLDECPLTLNEIDKIAKIFIRILTAMYHGRIKYPEKNNGNGNLHRKSSEKGKNKFPPNQADHNSDS